MPMPWQGFAPPTELPERTLPRKHLWREIKRHRNAYLFIAPFFVVFAVFMLFPILFSLFLSFQRWNGIMEMNGVGFSHYMQALHDENLHRAFANTAIFTILTVTLGASLGLGLALFLNSMAFLRRIYRGIFFVPAIVSLVVVSLVWKLILNSEVGLANELIHRVGAFLRAMTGYAPHWMQLRIRFLDNINPVIPLLTITLVNVWAVVGFNTVIFLAGLQGIPIHLYEVSRMDGATAFQNFRYITMPLLRPTTFFVLLISTIDALQVFVLPNVMNRDSDSTMTIVYYLYRNAFEFYKMGYASAIAYILFAMTLVISFIIRNTVGRDTRWSAAE